MALQPLQGPPKFGPNNPGPSSLRDWVQFWRWLVGLYRVVNEISGNVTPPAPPSPPVTSHSVLEQLIAQSIRPAFPTVIDQTARQDATQALTRVIPPFPAPGANAPLVDTYASWTATNYPPEVYAVGTTFLNTTWNVLYCVRLVAGVPTWVYETGTYIAATGSRPTTGYNGAALGTNDTGLLFIDATLVQLQYWTGAAWVVAPNIPTSATILASNSDKQVIAAALTSARIFVGNAGNLPAEVALSGDATLSNTGALTLANTGVAPGPYGDATHVATFTVDSKGRLTAAGTAAISSTPSGPAGGDLTGTYPNPTVYQATGSFVVLLGFGCNGTTPQGAYPTGAAVSATGATNVAPYGYTTAAQADDLVSRVNDILAALKANGIMA